MTREDRGGLGRAMFADSSSLSRSNFLYPQLHSDPNIPFSATASLGAEDGFTRDSSASTASHSYSESSLFGSNAWNQATPYVSSPWSRAKLQSSFHDDSSSFSSAVTYLVGSLIREEGHIYSLASSGPLLYTGSDSKNIRVWKNQEEFCGFKSNSGLVKAIVISGDRIYTGHQDGKIRVWKVSKKDAKVYKRAGTLPALKDLVKSSVKPSNYVEVRRHHSALWIKHSDAVSCLSLSEEGNIIYSGSWDKTFKVWRVSDSRCLESVRAHDDAVNAIFAGFDGLVFTGSADGTVKVWRRELHSKGTRHAATQTLLSQDSAVTSLALNADAGVVYSGSSDGMVNFWERTKSHMSHGGVLRGHGQAVLCMASAGSLVMSGSADGTICIWRREEGIHTCLTVLTGHSGPVKCLTVERDSESQSSSSSSSPQWIVYSGSLDKTVNVWKVSEIPATEGFFRRRPADASPVGKYGYGGVGVGTLFTGVGGSHRFESPLRK